MMGKRTQTPGVKGSTLELLVSGGERIQSIPGLLFAPLLLGIAMIATRITWPAAWLLWVFFLLDWSLMAALPTLKISYGLAKPPTLLLAILRVPFLLFPPPWVWILQTFGTLLVVYGFCLEPQRLVVTKQYLSTEKLDLRTPIRILHFGDLHLERITKREQKLIEMARTLEPDLILFSGDVLSYSYIDDGIAQQEARAVLSQIASNQTIYAVAGSPPMETQVPMQPAASTTTQAVQASPEPSETPALICGRSSPMNILVLLIREKGEESPQGALAMRLVHVDFPHADGGTVTFPRDLVLPLMGAKQERLGEIFRQGQAMPEGNPTRGASLVANTIWSAFGITIDQYVVVDLDQLAALIDEVGGVDVEIQQPYDASGIGLPHFQPGTTHMGGDMALEYATATDTGSIWDGLRRQTEVILALRDEILSTGMIARIPELFPEYRELVVTDLNLQDLIDLGCMLERVPAEGIPFEAVGPEVTQPGSEGALLPDVDAINALITVTFGDLGQ